MMDYCHVNQVEKVEKKSPEINNKISSCHGTTGSYYYYKLESSRFLNNFSNYSTGASFMFRP